MTEKEKKFQQVSYEIYTSERDYCEDLDIIIQVQKIFFIFTSYFNVFFFLKKFYFHFSSLLNL